MRQNHFIFLLLLSLLVILNSFNYQQVNKTLEAVLVVGNKEGSTITAINRMRKIASLLEENGFTVHEFYDKKAVWSKIIKKTPNAIIFIYDGHGTTLGENGNPGGLVIDQFISSQQIKKEMTLKKNALVLFQSVCYGAGSTATDRSDITVDVASDRVRSYSKPFFNIGASVYFASNYVGGVLDFLQHFLQGDSVEMAFEKCYQYWNVLDKMVNLDNGQVLKITSSESKGHSVVTTYSNGVVKKKKIPNFKEYDLAMVGNPKLVFQYL